MAPRHWPGAMWEGRCSNGRPRPAGRCPAMDPAKGSGALPRGLVQASVMSEPPEWGGRSAPRDDGRPEGLRLRPGESSPRGGATRPARRPVHAWEERATDVGGHAAREPVRVGRRAWPSGSQPLPRHDRCLAPARLPSSRLPGLAAETWMPLETPAPRHLEEGPISRPCGSLTRPCEEKAPSGRLADAGPARAPPHHAMPLSGPWTRDRARPPRQPPWHGCPSQLPHLQTCSRALLRP